MGREREVAAIGRLLTAAEPELRALVLEGEPGIGKTTVWQAVYDVASAHGVRVLSCRPVQAEAKLAFASLADLLEPIVDDGLDALPEPQRHALDVALLRAAPSGAGPDQRAVAAAVHSLLRACTADGPLAVAVDDAQWLDRASAAVLAFALRRLDASPLRVLLSLRVDDGAAVEPFDVERTLADAERVRLAPLGLSALHHVIGTRLGHVFPRPVLRRIVETTRGNPLFALELARALAETNARPAPGEPLPVPETLAALLQTRIARLSAAEQNALLAAAALAAPTIELVGADLADAQRAGVVTVHAGAIRFAHPLLASTVYSAAGAERRRAVHAALAAVVPDAEARSRHLALAADGPDEGVAAQLEAAGRAANLRGAPQAAVELLELAHRLTPTDGGAARARRALAHAEYAFRAGDTPEALRVVERALADEPPGPRRARVLEVRARIFHVAGTAPEAAAACEQALAEAGDDVELRARIHATLARVSWHDFELARRHGRAALELLDSLEDPDPIVLVQALVARVGDLVYSGAPFPHDLVDRALELERVAPSPDVADRMSAALGVWLKQVGDFDGARSWLDATYRAAVDEGDDASLPYALSHLPQLELWTGRWAESERRALEHLELAEEMAQPDQRRQALFNLAMVHAHLGRADEARAEAERLLADAEQADEPWSSANALAVLGLLELSLGNWAAAADVLARNFELREGIGAGDAPRSYVDYAAALVELGELQRAEEIVRLVDERARGGARAPTLAVAAYARGLVASARNELAAAAAAFEEALAFHDDAAVPFDRARTLLALGRLRRRRGERRAARDALEQAHASFDELGARLWCDRATEELARIPIRRRSADGADELTPTEERVAELAAAGRTNREMAQALFMSTKTVEANLTRIYRKLGVASRAELGATMARRAKA